MNLSLLLDMACDGFGDRVVVGQRDGGLTPERMRALAVGGAQGIRDAGADAVVYLAVNGAVSPAAMFAAAAAGVPLVPVNYRMGAEQLDALLANHTAAFGIAGNDEYASTLQRAGLSTVSPEEFVSMSGAVAAGEADFVPPEAPAVVIYTSGSTSTPKGVVLRHHNLVSYVLGTVEFAGAGAEEAALISVPPYHIAAVANVITNLYAGRRALVLEQFAPEEWLTLVRDEGVTNALVVPTMLKRILDAESDLSAPSLRTLAYGGAPMPVQVIERALEIWPKDDFVNAYGLTETSSTIAMLGPDDHRAALGSDDPAIRARLSSVGTVLPGVELEIRNDNGEVLTAGHKGRICVRGEQVSAEYAGAGPAVDARGFFDTRDEGYLDDGGYLFVSGRADDTIIRGAENIAPAEIEDVLLRHAAVSDVAVVGIPHEEWGQSIAALVVLRADATAGADELREHVRSALRSSKTPDQIFFAAELPRTETGRLIRRHIVEQLVS